MARRVQTIPMLRPQPGPQTQFFGSSADIVVYGGSAGGGKSWSLLADPTRWRYNSDFRGIIFRRNTKQLLNPGGLWDEATKMYPSLNAVANQTKHTWRWPSGAWLQMSHLIHEVTKESYQGAQFDYVGMDELTHYTESQFWYMQSRIRSVSGINGYTRCTTNPAPGWVRDFLQPWLNEKWDGPGGHAKSGEIRWFHRDGDAVVWLTPDEKYRRDNLREESTSVTFIRSSIHDNQILLKADPRYLARLKSMPEADRRKLLDGDWDVFEGQYFTEFAPHVHVEQPMRVGALPDWWNFFGGLDWGHGSPFAFVLCAYDSRSGITRVIESVKRAGITNDAQASLVMDILNRWKIPPQKCLISFDKSMQYAKSLQGIVGEADIDAYYRVGLTNAAPSLTPRLHGWNTIRRRLHCQLRASDGQSFKMRIWAAHNAELIRQFPLWQYGKDSEDLDTKSDDHLADALRYAQDAAPLESLPMGAQRTELRQAHLPHALQSDSSVDDLEIE